MHMVLWSGVGSWCYRLSLLRCYSFGQFRRKKKENKIGRCVGIRIVIYLFVPIVIVIGQPCVDRFTCCTHKCELCSSVSVGFECAV